MEYKESILAYAKNLGIEIMGFTSLRKLNELEEFYKARKLQNLENEFEESDILKRINLQQYMEDGKTIISIAFPYLFNKEENQQYFFSRYTQGKDYHTVVSQYLNKICTHIESMGGKAKYFVDSNALPERYIAKLCGVGFIGKNNMLITEKYGSYVFLGEIITDIYLGDSCESRLSCGECTLCLDLCPTKAINGKFSNPNICLSYITQKKHIEDKWFNLLQGRLFGCDTCQNICPHNKDVNLSTMLEFKPFDYMGDPNVEELIMLDKIAFYEKYKNTSCGWRGKNILQRNALINFIFNKGDANKVNSLNSPYVKEYHNRLLKYFNL